MNIKYFFLAIPIDDLKLFEKELFSVVEKKDLIDYRIDEAVRLAGKKFIKFAIEDKNYDTVRLFLKSFNVKPLPGHEDVYKNL